MNYQSKLISHLGVYAKEKLDVHETGFFRGKPYSHIIPAHLDFLNLLEPYRAQLRAFLAGNKIKLHHCFHHLNSSQAFAFNLFYPFFADGGKPASLLSSMMGIETEEVSGWEFECIPDVNEGTNIDIGWRVSCGDTVYCEVKLSENEFGAAKPDERHRKKRKEIYLPRLQGLVSDDLLNEEAFFEHYQLLRNVALLRDGRSQLVLLMPKANASLQSQLRRVLSGLSPVVHGNVHVRYIEDVLAALRVETSLPEKLRNYSDSLWEKYIPEELSN